MCLCIHVVALPTAAPDAPFLSQTTRTALDVLAHVGGGAEDGGGGARRGLGRRSSPGTNPAAMFSVSLFPEVDTFKVTQR